LFVTTSFGRRFSDIGPRLPPLTRVDDVSFLDRRHGWLVSWSAANVSVWVYRTSDGGRSWQRTAVTSHTASAGAVATVQFLSPRRGWLVNQQPTAPNARLYATLDGGASWRLVRGELPEIAPVVFANAHEAWQAGGLFSRSLFHSVDGGHTWTQARIPLAPGERPARAVYGLPAFFGRTIRAPVTFLHDGKVRLAVYSSGDDGHSWRLESTLNVSPRTAPRGDCTAFGLPELSIALATTRSWWVGGYRSSGWFAYRTANAGRSWQSKLIAGAKPPTYCPPLPELQGIDSRTAWFFLAGTNTGELYATADAARHWRRIQPP
jgi:photosystem II stability/assembly factor-like uncharacterized protein